MEQSDLDALVKAVARGDASAYRRLLEASARIIRGYLLARLSSSMRGDVEDIVQETLLAVHLKYNSYNPDLPFLPWLRAIAHHKLVDLWRRRKAAGTVPLDDDLSAVLAAPETDPQSNQATNDAMTLEHLMTSLSDKQQQIVRLARIDGKSMAEIANEMNLSVVDVKVSLHRAIKKLSETAKKEGLHAYG